MVVTPEQQVADRISAIRGELGRHPDFYNVLLPEGNTNKELPAEIPGDYARFLRLSDGPTCGTSFTFWGAEECLEQQSYADRIPFSELPLNPEEYFCCGLIEPAPFFVRRSDQTIWHIPHQAAEWFDSSRLEKAAENIFEFFLEKVAGDSYSDFVGLDESMKDLLGPADEWYVLLQSTGG
jgi:hypothetical protein